MDIGIGFQFADDATLKLINPVGDPLNNVKGDRMWIKMASVDSPKWKRAEQAASNRRIKTAQSRQGRANVTAAELEADRIENVVAVSLEWGGFITTDGQPIACSPESVRKCYEEHRFIFEQAEAWATNRENFMKGGSAA